MLNPIKTDFSTTKNGMKEIIGRRVHGNLREFIFRGVQTITLDGCIVYFHHVNGTWLGQCCSCSSL